jgi:hypothetical protein
MVFNCIHFALFAGAIGLVDEKYRPKRGDCDLFGTVLPISGSDKCRYAVSQEEGARIQQDFLILLVPES